MCTHISIYENVYTAMHSVEYNRENQDKEMNALLFFSYFFLILATLPLSIDSLSAKKREVFQKIKIICILGGLCLSEKEYRRVSQQRNKVKVDHYRLLT